MNGEPSRSSLLCQKNIWKTCVLCGVLNKKAAMRLLNHSLHLHVFVAYLKFTGDIDDKRDFSSYDDSRHYECFVCSSHVDVPARALRNIYAFPPETPIVDGKCDPEGFLHVLKKIMPSQFSDMTVQQLAEALPDSRVARTQETRQTDCSCCHLLESSRSRLGTVILNSEVLSDDVRMSFSVFEELTNIAEAFNFEKIDVEEKNEHFREDWSEEIRESESLLRKFEGNDKEDLRQSFIAARTVLPQQPLRRPLEVLPSHPGVPVAGNPIQVLLANNLLQLKKPAKEPSTPKIATPANNIFRSSECTWFSTTSNERKRRMPSSSSPPSVKISPSEYSRELFFGMRSELIAKVIMDSKLVVFTLNDLRSYFPGYPITSIEKATLQLEECSLLHKSRRTFPDGRHLYLKEFRRALIQPLWKYGMIPEHYCQRIVGIASRTSVRDQVSMYQKALLEMDQDPKLSGLVSEILSSSGNNDLVRQFERTKGGTIASKCKMRAPKLEHLRSD